MLSAAFKRAGYHNSFHGRVSRGERGFSLDAAERVEVAVEEIYEGAQI